jgi:hypothetical protein
MTNNYEPSLWPSPAKSGWKAHLRTGQAGRQVCEWRGGMLRRDPSELLLLLQQPAHLGLRRLLDSLQLADQHLVLLLQLPVLTLHGVRHARTGVAAVKESADAGRACWLLLLLLLLLLLRMCVGAVLVRGAAVCGRRVDLKLVAAHGASVVLRAK